MFRQVLYTNLKYGMITVMIKFIEKDVGMSLYNILICDWAGHGWFKSTCTFYIFQVKKSLIIIF